MFIVCLNILCDNDYFLGGLMSAVDVAEIICFCDKILRYFVNLVVV